MRTSQYLLSTMKETPADAEVISHQLMLRAGMIRRLASGLYTWLPTGLRVLRKVEAIVREEMTRAGAIEVLMPVVQPADLWQESGRWDQFGPELCRLRDRHDREFTLGPTHEEVITEMVRKEISSYKQLPINFFQIQTKFRDEVRPRFGVMRAREFIMKDAYSFHLSDECLQQTYDQMYRAYCAIFEAIGLEYRAVIADTGSIGGSVSHEFHVLAESGEDDIAFSSESDYAANVEMAEAVAPSSTMPASAEKKQAVATPGVHSISAVSDYLQVAPEQIVKTLIARGIEKEDGSYDLVALVVRGDHELNELKAEKIPTIASPLVMASDEEINAVIGCNAGSIGPCGLSIDIFVDRSAAHLVDFICGANTNDMHLTGVNWETDVSKYQVVDIRNVVEGDVSPDGKGTLSIKRGIEVGHIFQLGRKYSEAMKAGVLAESGKNATMTMGCYGIGVSRIVAAAIEQNNDKYGIIWPEAIAPFQLVIIPMNMHKSHRVQTVAENLYKQLSEAGIDVLFDDRKERPGVMFADMELIGIPMSIVIGERNLDDELVEYKHRRLGDKQQIKIDQVCQFVLEKVKKK